MLIYINIYSYVKVKLDSKSILNKLEELFNKKKSKVTLTLVNSTC